MKKNIFLILLLLLSLNSIFAQNELTETEKLATTAKIWGFLKYYHSQVANGEFNWDEELFKILPKVKNSQNKKQLSKIYIDWIDSLGKVKHCKKCSKKNNLEYFSKNFDLKWINNHSFTQELSKKLKFIELNRHQGEKYYVAISHKNIGEIKLKNENTYKNFDWKNDDLRLLTLFRYWNIIEYYFPYKYQTDMNWDTVLTKMIPKFLYPKNELDFHLAMLELVVNVDDSHAMFSSKQTSSFWGYYWVPSKFKLIQNKAIITGFYNDSLAKRDDIRIGDVITKVNNINVGDIFKQKKKYISGSNLARKKANAYFSIFNGLTGTVNIEFIRNNKTYSKTLKRYRFSDFNYDWNKTSEKYKILDSNIGYINMGVLTSTDVMEIMEKLNNTKAIIFDIRNYPKGTLYALVNYISSKSNDFYKVIAPDLNYPGKFIWRNGSQCGNNEALKYKGKVILLVNEKSQSHAEFTAMCLQTGDNVTTIGSQTSGADGNVSRFEILGGYKTAISGIGIFYPDKTETQRKGVKIDIEIKPTIQGIINKKDEVLEKAIEFINQ